VDCRAAELGAASVIFVLPPGPIRSKIGATRSRGHFFLAKVIVSSEMKIDGCLRGREQGAFEVNSRRSAVARQESKKGWNFSMS
jgi:hypothetical protein